MSKFKVGDRVKYKLVRDSINQEIIKGMLGSVKGYCSLGLVVVEWDKSTAAGHSQKDSKPGHAWNVFEKEIESTTTTTQKLKEPKTMTTKKPGTTHGKPTAKGMKVEKKPTAAKVSKYPVPRVQITALVPVKSLDKMTKLELIETYYALRDQFDNQAADHCIAGTKLDRALVDLKEAKKRIKELETLNAAATRLADDQRTEINRLQGARK